MRVVARLPRPALDSYEWQDAGLCRGMESEKFFTEDRESGQARRATRTREAKELCMRCPVVARCLRHALSVPEPYGIWGGLTAAERSHLQIGAAG